MKICAAVSCGLLMLSGAVVADGHTKVDHPWNISAFASYIDTDSNRGLANAGSGDDSGLGFAGALGYRYNPQWEVRFIANQWDFDDAENVNAFGLDVLYHLGQNQFYGIVGLKHEDISEIAGGSDGELINFGLGKRFALTKQLYLTAEGLFTQTFEHDGGNDLLVNLGLTYAFGPTVPKPRAKFAPVPKEEVQLDSDNDGVVDSIDSCPNTPATDAVDYSGCSRYTSADESVRLSINFANNDDKVAQHYFSEIERVADFMARYPDSKVVIEGHTSAQGGSAYNQKLSERRAKKVADILIKHFKLPAHRVSHIGYGESKLLNTADTRDAASQNRRIEARIIGSKKVKVKR